MSKPSDFVQGTLDLLILKIVALEPMHGWAISQSSLSEPRFFRSARGVVASCRTGPLGPRQLLCESIEEFQDQVCRRHVPVTVGDRQRVPRRPPEANRQVDRVLGIVVAMHFEVAGMAVRRVGAPEHDRVLLIQL